MNSLLNEPTVVQIHSSGVPLNTEYQGNHDADDSIVH